MKLLIEAARARGLKNMIGEVLASNVKMLDFARASFRADTASPDPRQLRATLDLSARDMTYQAAPHRVRAVGGKLQLRPI